MNRKTSDDLRGEIVKHAASKFPKFTRRQAIALLAVAGILATVAYIAPKFVNHPTPYGDTRIDSPSTTGDNSPATNIRADKIGNVTFNSVQTPSEPAAPAAPLAKTGATSENGECFDIQTHYKDFFHTLPEYNSLPYSFVSTPKKISTLAPSDTGIAVHFKFQKEPALPWVQVVDAEVEVHSFHALPKVVKPKVAYAAGLQPHILVVPLKPAPGVYKTRAIYYPLGLTEVSFDRPTHRYVEVEDMSSNPIEIRDDSPQPFIVVATSAAEVVYNITMTFCVHSQKGKQRFVLGSGREFAFVTEKTVTAAIASFDQLSTEDKAKVNSLRTKMDSEERPDEAVKASTAPDAPPSSD